MLVLFQLIKFWLIDNLILLQTVLQERQEDLFNFLKVLVAIFMLVDSVLE